MGFDEDADEGFLGRREDEFVEHVRGEVDILDFGDGGHVECFIVETEDGDCVGAEKKLLIFGG